MKAQKYAIVNRVDSSQSLMLKLAEFNDPAKKICTLITSDRRRNIFTFFIIWRKSGFPV
jgi:hypothetical protein